MLSHFQKGEGVNLVKPTYLAAETDKAQTVLADYKIRLENSKAVYMKSQRTESHLERDLTAKQEGRRWKVHKAECEVATQPGRQILKNNAGRA